jgi:hypothetical protein
MKRKIGKTSMSTPERTPRQEESSRKVKRA